MVSFDPVLNLIFDWLLSPFIWLILIFIFVAGTFGILWIRKKRKLIYKGLELVKYKNGNSGFNNIKFGWFGKKKYLGGLYDRGEERLETQDGEKILNFSTEDFKEVDGARAPVVYRDPNNPDILVPISNVNFEGEEMLAEIAPAEYRDAAAACVDEVDRETQDKTEKIIRYVLFGMVIIFALVSIIVIAQMVKQGQTEAKELILEAAKIVGSKPSNVAPSAAP